MALPYLHKSKKIQASEAKSLILDYKTIDPAYQKTVAIAQKEANEIIERAHENAKEILNHARKSAAEIERNTDEYILEQKELVLGKEKRLEEELNNRKEELENRYQDLFEVKEKEIEEKGAMLEAELQKKREALEKEIRIEIYEEVKKEALKDSLEECERLISRIQVILDESIKHRVSVFTQVEEQITDLVLMISRKVVKDISESAEGVVIRNVHEALKSLKGREHYIIRVNTKDLGAVKKHLPHIEECIEKKGVITLAEDSKVDPGGCIIETEFGEVDARITTHMQKIEQNIREAFPLKY